MSDATETSSDPVSAVVAVILVIAMIAFAVTTDHEKDKAWDFMTKNLPIGG